MALMKSNKPVGIIGYGAYVPRYRLPATEVSRVWTDGAEGTPIKEKSVPGLDEDVATMSIEAARNALQRAQIDPLIAGRDLGIDYVIDGNKVMIVAQEKGRDTDQRRKGVCGNY